MFQRLHRPTTPLILLSLLLCLIAGAARAQTTPVAQPAVGERIPAFDTRLLSGGTLAAKTLAGRPLLVMFWATWCPICRRELPQLQKLYEKHRAAGFEILALSIDTGDMEVEEFWQDHRYTFPVAMRAPRHSEIFGAIRTPPRFFLIGRDGKLAFYHVGALGPEQLEAVLKPLL